MKVNNKFYWLMILFAKSLKHNYHSRKIEAKKLQKRFNVPIIYINIKRRNSFIIGFWYLPFRESDLC